MARTLRTVAIMLLAPPLLLYAFVQTGLLDGQSRAYHALLATAWAAGMAAIVTSGWPLDVKCIVAAAYSLAAVAAFPFLILLAFCMTGNCI